MSTAFLRRLSLGLLVAFTLSGCATVQEKTKDNPKAVLGSLGGAAVGAGIAAIAGGNIGWIVAAGLLGALAGGAIGKHLDDKDKEKAAHAAAQAFESNRTGQPSVWENPDSGNRGSVTPTRTYQLASGHHGHE